jgi:hypothetical protein
MAFCRPCKFFQAEKAFCVPFLLYIRFDRLVDMLKKYPQLLAHIPHYLTFAIL